MPQRLFPLGQLLQSEQRLLSVSFSLKCLISEMYSAFSCQHCELSLIIDIDDIGFIALMNKQVAYICVCILKLISSTLHYITSKLFKVA